MNHKSLLFGIVCVLLFGCTEEINEIAHDLGDDTISAKLGSEFELNAGQSASISSESLEITFANITEDSRCPVDVLCVRAGEVKALVDIAKGNETGEVTLVFPKVGATEEFLGYSIDITGVKPEGRNRSERLELSNYTIKLLVSKK
jgi:hypothetical protein